MEKPESARIVITQEERNAWHERLMRGVLASVKDTPLVLKGGTALYLGYGLNRFSEDLDFDSNKRLNLSSKLGRMAIQGITIDNINVKKTLIPLVVI